LRHALKTLSLRDAAASVAADTGVARRQLYNRALELKSGG
jgi:DNA-binding phage protein